MIILLKVLNNEMQFAIFSTSTVVLNVKKITIVLFFLFIYFFYTFLFSVLGNSLLDNWIHEMLHLSSCFYALCTVLSDSNKRFMYDVGVYDSDDDDENVSFIFSTT